MNPQRWPRVVSAAATSVLSLSVYLGTMAPSLTWAHDSADGPLLAAAAQTLGIAHPPGHPTYLLLAHPFAAGWFSFSPFREVAFRTNLFSACCAVLTVALLTWTLSRDSVVGALFAGLTVTLCPLMWAQATVTEVHTLQALLVTSLLACAVQPPPLDPKMRRRRMGLAGALWGLGLGNHPLLLLCAPLLWAAWRQNSTSPCGRDVQLSRQNAVCLGLGLVCGLSIYLYLPLRALSHPSINWGDPSTVQKFFAMLLARPYQGFLFALPWSYLPQRIFSAINLIRQQLGWLGTLFVLWGVISRSDRDRILLEASGSTVLLCALFAIGYNTTDSYLYLLPAVLCLTPWLSRGVREALAWLRQGWLRQIPWAVCVLLLLPVLRGLLSWPEMDLSSDAAVDALKTGVLDAAPSNALLLSDLDAHTFSLWYWQHALGERLDLKVVDTSLLAEEWYANALVLEHPQWAQAVRTGYFEDLSLPVCRIIVKGSKSVVLHCTTGVLD